jgi:multidrug transporter EmrE-like cation transporter
MGDIWRPESVQQIGGSTVVLIIMLIVICEMTAQSCIKQSEQQSVLFFIAIVLYATICYLLFLCYMNRGKLGQVNMMWSSISIVSGILVGYFIFGESVSMNRIIAISLAIGAVYFAQDTD